VLSAMCLIQKVIGVQNLVIASLRREQMGSITERLKIQRKHNSHISDLLMW